MPRGLTSPPQKCGCKRHACTKVFYAYPDRKGSSGKYPRFCSRACYLADAKWHANHRRELKEREAAKAATTPEAETIRVPAKFYNDHDDRACEPFCEPVRRSGRFVWLRHDDPGLDELLDDARHYADPDMFGTDYADLRRSAAATVKAITSHRAATTAPAPAERPRRTTIRVPAVFIDDHYDRGLPTPADWSDSKTYAVVNVNDPDLNSLLEDAEHYAHPSGPDLVSRGLTASAVATVRAIRDVTGWDDAAPAIVRRCRKSPQKLG